MRLEVIGTPAIGNGSQQCIRADYNPKTECTTVFINADIVTAKIAAAVLEEKYLEAVKQLTPEMVEQVEKAVREALNHGQDRG